MVDSVWVAGVEGNILLDKRFCREIGIVSPYYPYPCPLSLVGADSVEDSIALALSVPRSFGGEWIVTSTYVMVVFSILVQGSTMGLFLKWRLHPTTADLAEAS